MVKYLKFIQEKINTSNKIPIEQVENILRVRIKYAEATYRNPTPVQMWQKLESIESLAKKQSQQQNCINNKLTVLKLQQAEIVTSSKSHILGGISGQRKVTSSPL